MSVWQTLLAEVFDSVDEDTVSTDPPFSVVKFKYESGKHSRKISLPLVPLSKFYFTDKKLKYVFIIIVNTIKIVVLWCNGYHFGL